MAGDPGADGMRWLWDQVAGLPSLRCPAPVPSHELTRAVVRPEPSPAPYRAA
jgi:hypothetical protein